MVAVAMEATERTVKICVPFFCKVSWEKLLHLLGRTQGGRASNLPSVNMARSCLSLPEFLKQSGIRYVCSSTAGKGVKAPQGGQPHTSPTMQGGGTGPQAKVQHLSQNGYTSLSLSLSFSRHVYKCTKQKTLLSSSSWHLDCPQIAPKASARSGALKE